MKKIATICLVPILLLTFAVPAVAESCEKILADCTTKASSGINCPVTMRWCPPDPSGDSCRAQKETSRTSCIQKLENECQLQFERMKQQGLCSITPAISRPNTCALDSDCTLAQHPRGCGCAAVPIGSPHPIDSGTSCIRYDCPEGSTAICNKKQQCERVTRTTNTCVDISEIDTSTIDPATLSSVSTPGTLDQQDGTPVLLPDVGFCGRAFVSQLSRPVCFEGQQLRTICDAQPSNINNDKIAILGTCTCDAPPTAAPCTMPPANLVSYWNFENIVGGKVPDIVGINEGLISSPTIIDGKIGKAIQFDGTSNFIEVPPHPSLDLTQYTIEAWIKSDGIDQWDTILAKGPMPNENYALFIHNGQKLLHHALKTGVRRRTFDSSAGTIKPNQWMHVAVIVEDQVACSYVNGRETCISLDANEIPEPNDNSLRIGLREGSSLFFKGAIDEVAMYNKALTRKVIEQHYVEGNRGKSICEIPTNPDTADQELFNEPCATNYPKNKFHVCYFKDIQPKKGSEIAVFQKNEKPVSTGDVTQSIYNDWGIDNIAETRLKDFVYGIWRGSFQFRAGDYIFTTFSDDGVRLNVEGEGEVINRFTGHPETKDESTPIFLNGEKKVTLEWFENFGDAVIKLSWRRISEDSDNNCIAAIRRTLHQTIDRIKPSVVDFAKHETSAHDTFQKLREIPECIKCTRNTDCTITDTRIKYLAQSNQLESCCGNDARTACSAIDYSLNHFKALNRAWITKQRQDNCQMATDRLACGPALGCPVHIANNNAIAICSRNVCQKKDLNSIAPSTKSIKTILQ